MSDLGKQVDTLFKAIDEIDWENVFRGLITAGVVYITGGMMKDSNYKPSKEELDDIISKIDSSLCLKTSSHFMTCIKDIIYTARNELKESEKDITKKNLKEKLKKVESGCLKIKSVLESEDPVDRRLASFILADSISYNVDSEESKDKEYNLLGLVETINILHERCNIMQDELGKSYIRKQANSEIRLNVAKTLIALFNEENINVTKFKDGQYANTLKIVLESCKYYKGTDYLEFTIPDDMFKLISKAIDEFEDSKDSINLPMKIF